MSGIKYNTHDCETCEHFSCWLEKLDNGLRFVQYDCSEKHLYEIGVGPCDFYEPAGMEYKNEI